MTANPSSAKMTARQNTHFVEVIQKSGEEISVCRCQRCETAKQIEDRQVAANQPVARQSRSSDADYPLETGEGHIRTPAASGCGSCGNRTAARV